MVSITSTDSLLDGAMQMAATTTHPLHGPLSLGQEVGLQRWQVERAEAAGMLPPRGDTRGWLAEQLDAVRALVPSVVARFGAQHPLGAVRCCGLLAARLGVEVQVADIQALAEAGHLDVVDVFTHRDRTYELFSPDAVEALDAALVADVIAAREAGTAASVSFDQACERLGRTRDELDQVVAEREIERGRFGRLPRAAVDGLAGDVELGARILADRLLNADQAAQRLDLARRHVDIAVEAGWLIPVRSWPKQVGRYTSVDVALYRTGDVDALLQRRDVGWESVRTIGKGERSPLLDLVGGRAPTRAKLIRAFLREYGAERHIEMWAWWQGPDRWEIDWERPAGGPTRDDVATAIADRPGLARYRDDIVLHSAAGAAIRFARAMLEPGRAVILDTETTDLYDAAICEIAVIDAATGETLLDTLVNPGVPITPGAHAVHGISDDDVTAPGVPSWAAVYRRLLQVTKDCTILAYNADYDRSVIATDSARAGIRRTRLAQLEHWADVMLQE